MASLVRRQGLRLFDKLTGHHIMQRFEELNRTQWLNEQEMRALQQRRLGALLAYACKHVPHYQRVCKVLGCQPEELAQDPSLLPQIPPVTKVDMREHPEEFTTTEVSRCRDLRQSATSGSTGEPFVFWEDCRFQDYANANTMRHHTWCGWQSGQPRAYLWGTAFGTSLQQRLRDKGRNLAWHCYFVNAFNLCEETMGHLAHVLRKRKPVLLHGYASALYHFARFVRQKGWGDVRVPAVYSSSDVLFPHQRTYIEETLGCRVFNRYATHEVGGIACECEQHTGMHVSTDTVYLEILDEDDQPVAAGQPGHVVVTSLVNYAFPFIRYRLEDVACLSPQHCPCGRAQPMLEKIEGRQNDMFRTQDGRMVLWGIDRPLKTMEGVKKFQFIQKDFDHVVVQVVKVGAMSQAQRDNVERTLRIALGDDVKVDFEFPEDIAPAPSGKYRYTICELDGPH